MAKRHTDTRFIVQAIPTLFRLTGKNANQQLRQSMADEKCPCGNPALITRTMESSTGVTIKRFCLECIQTKIGAPSPTKKVPTNPYDEIKWQPDTRSFAEKLMYPNGRPQQAAFPTGTLNLR